MSETNGTATSAIQQLKEARAELRLIKARHEIAILERRTKKIQESNILWDWMSGYQDLLDRLRTADGKLLLAPSTVHDRRHGANWPHWRTWAEHSILRAQSRFLATVSDIAFGALSGLTSYVVGDGMTYLASAKKGKTPPPSLVDAVQEVIDHHVEINGQQELEQECFKRTRRDGEVFTRDFTKDDGTTRVRIVAPEAILEDSQEPYETGSFGCRNAPGDIEDIEAYFVCYDGLQSEGEWVDSGEVNHLKVNVDREVKRGMPDFVYDSHDGIKSAGRCVQNMVDSAAIQAAIAEIRQHQVATRDTVQTFADEQADFQTSEPHTGTQINNQRVQPGTVRDIPAGLVYVPPPFSQGGQTWIMIVQASLRRVGVKWNAPEWLTSADASNNNYASSLVAESPFYRRCKRWQGTYSRWFLAGIKRAVKNACDAGRVRAEGRTWTWAEVKSLVSITVEPPPLETRKLLEETQRNQIRVQAGILSPQTWSQQDGLDYEQEQKNIEEHQERTGQGPNIMFGGDDQGGGLGLFGQDQPLDIGEALEIRTRGERDLMEAILLEAGFTGTKKVMIRGKEQTWYYQDGKRVAAPKKEEPTKGKGSKKKPEKKPQPKKGAEEKPKEKPGKGKDRPAEKPQPKPQEKAAKEPAPVANLHDHVMQALNSLPDEDRDPFVDMDRLRQSVPASQRAELDDAIWKMVKERKVFVQRHNQAGLLSEEERNSLLSDGEGGYYHSLSRGDAPEAARKPQRPAEKEKPVAKEPSAADIQAIADATKTGGFGDNKVMISHAYENAKKKHPDLTMDRFKELLIDANRRGDIHLSRADLVQAMNADDVSASETSYLNAKFHFILTKPDESRAWSRPKEPEKPVSKTDHSLADDHPVSKALSSLGVKLTPELLADPEALAAAIRAAATPVPKEKRPKKEPKPETPATPKSQAAAQKVKAIYDDVIGRYGKDKTPGPELKQEVEDSLAGLSAGELQSVMKSLDIVRKAPSKSAAIKMIVDKVYYRIGGYQRAYM